jgi:hypothetical protein
MDKLSMDFDLSWTIANGSVVIQDALNPPLVNRVQVAVLGPTILDGPIVEEMLKQENKEKEKVIRRIRCVSMLLPYIYAGVPIQFKTNIFDRSFTGMQTSRLKDFDNQKIYIAEDVVHKGSDMTRIKCITDVTTKESEV